MAKPTPFAKVEIDVDAEGAPLPEKPEPDTPFRILILGDFSGRAGAGRRPLLVDRDNFEDVLAKVAPELELAHSTIRFRELDDFHPDRLFERVELFAALRDTREKLSDRATFASTAAELQPPSVAPAAPVRPFRLSDLVEETEARPARALDDFSAMVRDLVRPHLVPGADPRQVEMVAKVDEATSAAMRDLLHHPKFQALEAAWRGLFFLVRRLDTDVALKLYILDVSKTELAVGLATSELRSTELYRVLVRDTVETPGAEPWAVVAGNYTFDDSVPDVVLLGAIGGLARAAGAPFLAAASPSVMGAELGRSPEPETWKPVSEERKQAWGILRNFTEARYIGLAMPRFVLRLPYGRATDPTEAFPFEEFPGQPNHEDYLWANPAFACVCLLGQAFSKRGWELRPGEFQDIDGLPAHIYREDGDSKMKPCAEALLTENAALDILDRGVMPLVSLKNRDTVRLLRLQSLADPPAALAGRWS